MVKSSDFMQIALAEARLALDEGEIPVGAVVVRGGEIIAQAHNRREQLHDPTAHAEMLALREASQRLKRWRLQDVDVYVTLEPCSMCAGAMVLARIQGVIFGTFDSKGGAAGSVFNVLENPDLNHQVVVRSGVLAEEGAKLLRQFFEKRRQG